MNWTEHRPMVRHLYMQDGVPNIADPMAILIFAETPTGTPVEGVLGHVQYWTGWRTRLIRWLINRWMPRPTAWHVLSPPVKYPVQPRNECDCSDCMKPGLL
jgi:hypothetical protein